MSATAHALDLTELKRSLDAVCHEVRGNMGYCLKLLKSGQTISFNGDMQFKTASTGKIPIALEAIRQVDDGALKWSDTKVVPPIEGRQASPWGYYLKDGVAPNL